VLEALIAWRDIDFRTEPERERARLQALESTLQRTLEKLRDLHDPK
jgi:hypothetical protein